MPSTFPFVSFSFIFLFPHSLLKKSHFCLSGGVGKLKMKQVLFVCGVQPLSLHLLKEHSRNSSSEYNEQVFPEKVEIITLCKIEVHTD